MPATSRALGLVALVVAIVALAPAQTEKPDTRPTVIVILADDLGYGDLGCYGGPHPTPHLDALAREGLRFTDFHSNGVVCSPTRAALMTGRYQQRAGIPGVVFADPKRAQHRHGLQPVEVTLAEAMGDAGYRTGMFGKWHLGYLKKYHPMRHGFARFVGFKSGNVDYQSHFDQALTFDWWQGEEPVDEKGYLTRLITKHATAFLAEAPGPAFLYVAHGAPHYPYQGPDDPPVRSKGSKRLWNARAKDHVAKAYPAMIKELDASVGAIIAAVKKSPARDRTFVFFMSDNGPAGPGRSGGLRGRKGQVWEGGHRVPAIAWWPGRIAPASTTDALTATFDVMPTMLGLAGVESPKTRPFDGKDLGPVLFRGKGFEDRELHFAHGRQSAIRRGRWKLVSRAPGQPSPGLFDVLEDRAESRDLSEVHPTRVAQL
ncbi:MAG: N-acetylgalactosamine-6-sulfate sulfatase, partial [Planctomycetes bacterium]|nr:N-acetylgalactosamine-6-sulfate sulfatase [Planctomycetota bacterium]